MMDAKCPNCGSEWPVYMGTYAATFPTDKRKQDVVRYHCMKCNYHNERPMRLEA